MIFLYHSAVPFADARDEQPHSGQSTSADQQKTTLDTPTQAQDSFPSNLSQNHTDSGVHSELHDEESLSLGFPTHHSNVSTGAAQQLERVRSEFDDHLRNVAKDLSSHLQTGWVYFHVAKIILMPVALVFSAPFP